MAEDTPGNLGGMFGGWMMGRAAGNRRLDHSVDRLEEQITRLADALQRLTGSIGGASRAANGGATQQSSTARPNGGGSTFNGMPSGGAHAGPAPGIMGTIANAGWGYQGAHEAGSHSSGYPSWDPRSTGGAHANGGSGITFGGIARQYGPGVAKGVGGGLIAAGAIYTANHYTNQQIGSTLAMQYAGGPNWSQAYRAGLMNNFSAANDADAWATANILGARSGYLMGSQGYNIQRTAVQSISATNPSITNQAAATGALALGSVGSFNRLRGMGINPLGAGGTADPRSVARQLLQRMGSSRVRTPEQVAAAFGPSGSATVTVNSYVAQGMIPAESAPMILSEMRNILQAQVSGMSYNDYNTMANIAATQSPTSATGKAARQTLQGAGIAANTLVQQERGRLGLSRESEGKTIEGFVQGVSGATTALNKFRDALNSILGLPGVGRLAGISSGATGTMPILGSVLGHIPGAGTAAKFLGGLGGAAPTMSSGRYGGAGGYAQARQSAGGGGGGGGGHAHAGAGSNHGSSLLHLIAPRPGLNSMSSEQDFGPRTIGQGFHTGIDLEGRVGDPVKAAADGIVVAAGWGASGDAGYGNTILISHGGGWTTMYAHLSAISKGKGSRVRAGEVIGRVGDTGSYSQGSHLHFELHRNGKPVNPEPYLRGAGISSPGVQGGGTSGGGVAGGTGASMGSTQGYANAITGDGGGMTIGGTYSENAALALGSPGGMAGAVGPSTSPSMGGPGGGGGMFGGPGGPGRVSIGSYNVRFDTANNKTAADFNRAIGKVNVLGLQEMRQKGAFASKWFGDHGWSYYGGGGVGDTGIAWNSDKYTALQKRVLDLVDSKQYNGNRLHSGSSYVLLKDKDTGSKFWVVSTHAQAHLGSIAGAGAVQRQQYAQLANLFKQLRSTGMPVFSVGDFNNRRAGGAAPGAQMIGGGIDHILYSGAKHLGGGSMAGGGGVMNSDHPFMYSNFSIGSSRPHGLPSGGSPEQNMQLGRAMAAKYGWSGAQWAALKTLWMHESGWRTNADNPTSSAYGIPQALTSLHHLGANYMNNPDVQIRWGLNYIKGRYGSPSAAWNFWQKNHWYDVGEWNIRDDKDARVHKGEMVIPSKIADVVRQELEAPGIRDNLGRSRSGSGGGMQITFERGAINISLPGAPNKRKAEQAAEWVIDAMMEDARMKALAEGR